ncbi:type I restriction endonuclease [uncultured Methanobrevibacter sp.]|uniref:type I restriction endonuclease n=1 Tax=uncultured Methanobrevibacter sp. TaxID=253161 RepID=UPI0025E76DFD|nr:type I restriction endonuclease [uncultured Methanobrevibacter sp.]
MDVDVESEAMLEEKFIEQLKGMGYEFIKIKNEEELNANFKIQLEKINKKELNGTSITDEEFDRILTYLDSGSIFDRADKLRDEYTIKRDGEMSVSIKFLNQKDWCKNIFQVSNQITMVGLHTNRYDVTLLINGLPLVQVELKRRSMDIKQAFNQVKRYMKTSYDRLFKYIQIFVISNGNETKYFANGRPSTINLRFDFDDEWKKVKLKDIVERVTRKNTNLETDLALTISAEYGLIDQEEFFNKIVASKSLKNYYLIKKGEFAYNKSYSNGYPYGAIKRLDDYPMGALSTLYICFKPTNISSDYLKEYFETTFWYKEIYSIAVEGARNHGLLNINVNDFFNTKHLIPPSTEEQEKIADLFKSINSKIDAVNNDLKLVKNFKNGLLQQMFI